MNVCYIVQMEQKFTEIYDKNKWGGGSGSGSKSNTPDNKKYLSVLEDIITKKGIHTVCDVGCGDFETMKAFDFANIDYLGIDVVQSVIDHDTEHHKRPNVHFERQDISVDPVRGFDLVILKDVIQHWKDEDIVKTLDELVQHNLYVFLANGYKFLRDPTKNNWSQRCLDNNYHYHPVDIHKEPLHRYHSLVLQEAKHRAKQFVLLRGR